MDKNFDKLFKTKVEQQSFDYNSSEWDSFVQKRASLASKSGKTMFGKLMIAGFIIGLSLISILTYVLATNYFEKSEINRLSQNNSPFQKSGINALSKLIDSPIDTKSETTIEQENTPKTTHTKPEKSNTKPEKSNNLSNNPIAEIQTVNKADNSKTSVIEIVKEQINSETTKVNENTFIKPIEISETTNSNTSVEIKSNNKAVVETSSEIIPDKKDPSKPIENDNKLEFTENKTSTDLPVNNVNTEIESKAAVTPKKYAYEDYPVVGGEAKQKANFSFAQFKRSLENYLSISQIGLERSRDIAVYINNHFIQDPTLSGFENRYTFSASSQVGALVKSIENKATPPYEYMITNSFPIRSKNMGVGIAFKQIHGGSYNSVMLNLSMSFQALINRNSSIYFGGGINANSIDKTTAVMTDFPWGSNPQPIKSENQASSFNLGVRYLHKSVYVGVSATNVYTFAFTGDYHKSLSPLALRFCSGGKLRLNQNWSLNPSLNYQYTPYSTTAYFVPYVSLSKLNKLYFGLHSENFKSIGAHIGYRIGNSVNLFLRSGLSIDKPLRDAYGIIHYGEIGFRIELGDYQK